MPKSTKESRPAVPSKADILAFVASEQAAATEGHGTGKVGKREIARAFGVKGDDRVALKAVLRDLEDEGMLRRRGKAREVRGAMPAMVVAEITGHEPARTLIARPADWDAVERGPAPAIALAADARGGDDGPGVGDRVLVRLRPAPETTDEPARLAGRVVKVIDKAGPRLLGLFRRSAEGGGRVLPIEKKHASADLVVPEDARGGALEGDLVAVEVLGRARSYGPQPVRVVERIGPEGSERAVSLLAILSHRIPHVFGPEAVAEAEAAALPGLEGREDWRDLPLVTIDPPDAKDHDDAVHAQAVDDADNPRGFVVTVAIADVACFVRPGSAMDREALDRGNSVYFPDRVVPMLPERVSTDLGSLKAGEDRPALAVRLVLGADGRKLRHSFHRVMIRCAAGLHYAQAQAAIDGAPDAATAPLLDAVLRPLWAAYAAAQAARGTRAPLALDLPERKVVLDADGKVERVVVPARLDAHRLIEEFMILANVAAAETLEAKRQALVYRAHDAPSLTKLAALGEFLATIGIKLGKGQAMRPAQFNGILGRVRGTEHEHLVNEVVLRTQAQAEYTVENYGHYGLNLARYAHFTSPIRRYADLVVHRALIRALGLGDDGLPDSRPKDLGEVAARISGAERRAMAAERETIDRLIADHLAGRIGATFEARVSGVTRAGLFVRLSETGADGFVPMGTLGNEYFSFDDASRSVRGQRTGTTYRLGDVVDVKLVEAAPLAGALRFEIAGGEGRRARTPRGARPGSPFADKRRTTALPGRGRAGRGR